MNTIPALITAAAVACAAPALAASVVIDFDTDSDGVAIADGATLTTQYDGVTFSMTENGLPVSAPMASSQFASETGGAPVLGNFLKNLYSGNQRADELTIAFGSAVSGISFDFIPFGELGPNTGITAFGASGLLFSGTLGGPASTNVNFGYTGIQSLTGVTSVVFAQPADSWVWGLDNLRYETAAAVPVPASLPLLLAGLGGLGLGARRRAG